VSRAQLLRLVLQISALLLLSRLLGAGMGKAGAGGAPAPRVFAVPYSEFVKSARAQRVASVQIDGVHILWQPRADAPLPVSVPKRAAPAGANGAASGAAAPAATEPAVLFAATRPADAAVPYEQLLAGGAQFGAPDKRVGNRVVTVMARVWAPALRSREP
jgi:hypothetical protein